MSAFICSDRHIATIALAYGELTNMDTPAIQGLADLLKRENVRSVNYRYKERSRIKPCDLSQGAKPGEYNSRDLLTLVSCLNYQSCERPDYLGAALKKVQITFGENLGRWPGPLTDSLWSI